MRCPNERNIIESTGPNMIAPANLARRDTRLPRSAARRRDRRGASVKHAGNRRINEKAFVVEVKRRWSSAKEKVLRGLGLYGQMEEMPLGLIIDLWV